MGKERQRDGKAMQLLMGTQHLRSHNPKLWSGHPRDSVPGPEEVRG